MILKEFNFKTIKQIYKQRMKTDFPSNERIPYFMLKKLLKKGITKFFLYKEDEKIKGYAVCIESDKIVFLYYFAIFKEYRGNGCGSKFIEELAEFYEDKKAIICEVESIETAKNDSEKNIRKRRVDFYKRLGFKIVDEIKYIAYGVDYKIIIKKIDETFSFELQDIINEVLNCYKSINKRSIRHIKTEIII